MGIHGCHALQQRQQQQGETLGMRRVMNMSSERFLLVMILL